MRKTTKETKRPTHAIYQVQGEGDKAYWNRIGAAWLHEDEKGANMVFDAFPLTGRIVLREIVEKDDSKAGGQ
jgi:hypothetical protein